MEWRVLDRVLGVMLGAPVPHHERNKDINPLYNDQTLENRFADERGDDIRSDFRRQVQEQLQMFFVQPRKLWSDVLELAGHTEKNAILLTVIMVRPCAQKLGLFKCSVYVVLQRALYTIEKDNKQSYQAKIIQCSQNTIRALKSDTFLKAIFETNESNYECDVVRHKTQIEKVLQTNEYFTFSNGRITLKDDFLTKITVNGQEMEITAANLNDPEWQKRRNPRGTNPEQQ